MTAAIVKQQSLLRSTTLVSLMTFISRMTGFVRDMVIAQLFGSGAAVDAFVIAFRIPNFMRRLFAEGAFSQAFVPVLAEYQQTQTVEEVRTFIARVAGRLSFVLSLVTIVGIICAPIIIMLFAPGFGEDSSRTFLATTMLKITFPYLMLVSLTAFSGAILNTYGYFGVPAITPMLLNLSMIVFAVYFSPYFNSPILSLAWGVLVAGLLQFFFQLPFLFHRKLLVKPKRARKDPGVQRVMKLMVPALFGVSIAQLNLMVDSIFASFLQVGSVSWLYYTDRLTDFPLGVFGVAIATVILPHLSRRYAEQNQEHFSKAIDWGLRSLLVVGVPASVGLALFSMPLIACCFGYGHFSLFDLLQTQKSLIALSIGVPAFMTVKILASGFYAQQDISTPVKVGALAMVVNTILCACLIKFLAHAGLALASSLAGYVNCGVLLYILIKRKIFRPKKNWLLFLGQLAVANGIMALYLLWRVATPEHWLDQSALSRLLSLLIEISTAVIIYLVSLRALGVKATQFRGVTKR